MVMRILTVPDTSSAWGPRTWNSKTTLNDGLNMHLRMCTQESGHQPWRWPWRWRAVGEWWSTCRPYSAGVTSSVAIDEDVVCALLFGRLSLVLELTYLDQSQTGGPTDRLPVAGSHTVQFRRRRRRRSDTHVVQSPLTRWRYARRMCGDIYPCNKPPSPVIVRRLTARARRDSAVTASFPSASVGSVIDARG